MKTENNPTKLCFIGFPIFEFLNKNITWILYRKSHLSRIRVSRFSKSSGSKRTFLSRKMDVSNFISKAFISMKVTHIQKVLLGTCFRSKEAQKQGKVTIDLDETLLGLKSLIGVKIVLDETKPFLKSI